MYRGRSSLTCGRLRHDAVITVVEVAHHAVRRATPVRYQRLTCTPAIDPWSDSRGVLRKSRTHRLDRDHRCCKSTDTRFCGSRRMASCPPDQEAGPHSLELAQSASHLRCWSYAFRMPCNISSSWTIGTSGQIYPGWFFRFVFRLPSTGCHHDPMSTSIGHWAESCDPLAGQRRRPSKEILAPGLSRPSSIL